jgi:hypothetical protein
VVEPDGGYVDSPGSQANQPGRAPGTAHLDQIRALVGHNPAGGLGGQHEPVRFLGRNRRTVKAIAADTASLQDLVFCARNHQHLPEHAVALDVTSLLQEIGPHSSGGLTEELGDVQNAEVGRRPEPGGQLRAGDVERARGGRAQRLEIENRRSGVSQSSPRVGTSCRSCRRDSCTPMRGRRRGSCSGCT